MTRRPLCVVLLSRRSLAYESRTRREAAALAAAGHSVTVVAAAAEGLPERELLGDVRVIRVEIPSTRARLRRLRRALAAREGAGGRLRRRGLGAGFGAAIRGLELLPLGIRRALRLHLDYHLATRGVLAELRPDVVQAGALNTLFAAWRHSRTSGAALVYDAHELELSKRTYVSRAERAIDVLVERAGLRAAAGTITVSDGIADELARRYRIARPAVVLNSPSLAGRLLEPPLDLRRAARLGPDDALVLFVGGTAVGKRGLEQLLGAIAQLPARFHLGFLGPPPREPTRRALEREVEARRIADRVHWLGPVAPELVTAAVRAADCTVIPLQKVHRHYEVTLPNKLFESVMAGVPVGVSRLEALERFVEEHGVGVVFDERDEESIAAAIRRLVEMRRDEALSARFERAQQAIAWEGQERILLGLYDRVRPLG